MCAIIFLFIIAIALIKVHPAIAAVLGIVTLVCIIAVVRKSKNDAAELKLKIETERKAYFDWLNSNYNISKLIGSYEDARWNKNTIVAVDDNKKVILFGKKEIPYQQILQVELIRTSSEKTLTETKQKHGVGRAVVGHAIAGPVGAIVGSNTARSTSVSNTKITSTATGVNIYLSNVVEPSFNYSSAQEQDNLDVYSTILAIISQKN